MLCINSEVKCAKSLNGTRSEITKRSPSRPRGIHEIAAEAMTLTFDGKKTSVKSGFKFGFFNFSVLARTGSKKPSVEIDPDELVLTSQYVFQEPYKKSSSNRVVLKPGDEPPQDAVKPEKNSCMPMRVAIEPRSDSRANDQKVTVTNYLAFQK